LIREDEEFIYLKSISSKLSIFAIVGEEIILPPKLECPPCPEPTEWSDCIEGIQKKNKLSLWSRNKLHLSAL